jgi:hypothetical protein
MKQEGQVNIEGTIESVGRDYMFVSYVFTCSRYYCSRTVTVECLACRVVDEGVIVWWEGMFLSFLCPA